MSGSADLDLFISIRPGNAKSPPPLYFHHIPKTAGTSFRAAVAEALLRQGASRVQIADVEAALHARGEWPDGFSLLHEGAAALGEMRACLSHYTALLADKVAAPILSLVRDPDEQFWSRVHFDPALSRTLAPDQVAKRFSNLQMKSLSCVRIPARQPESAKERRPWIDLVDKVAARFTLFRLSDFPALLDYCEETHGLSLREMRKKDSARRSRLDDEARQALEDGIKERDPVWLDRILYDRVPERARLRPRTAA